METKTMDDINTGDKLDIEMVSADGNELSATVDVLDVPIRDNDGVSLVADMNGTEVEIEASKTVEGLESTDGMGRILNNSQRIATLTSMGVR